jgi:methyl-accepting chemotaxis protein
VVRQGGDVHSDVSDTTDFVGISLTAMARDDSRALLEALLAVRQGDFSVRMPLDRMGVTGKIADAFNDIVAANQKMAAQLETVGQVVGRDGRTSTRVKFGLSDGAWADMEGSINTLIDDLLWPTTAVTRTITAVAKGDLLRPCRSMSMAGH